MGAPGFGVAAVSVRMPVLLVLLAVASAVVLGALPVLLPEPSGTRAVLLANLAAVPAPAVAAGCAVWRSTRSTGRRRQAWAVFAGALASWTVGDLLWAWLEASGRTPFPSVADVAYLAFGPLVCVGLLLLPVGGTGWRRLQGVLDGVATAWALLLVSWETALGAALRAAEDDRLPSTLVAAAYPVTDVAVTVLTLFALARAAPGTVRLPLALLAGGLLAISAADSTFVFLTANGGYQVGDQVDAVWSVGFGLLAVAALLDRHVDPRRDPRSPEEIAPAGGLLPYLPVATALAVMIIGRDPAPLEEAAVLLLIMLLLTRQYLTVRQNVQLVARVAAREEELRHQAFHDPLTGLANRALFRDRLEHALDLHARDRRPVAVLFLDLDGFKRVNDGFGHSTGDQLLVRAGERMLGSIRTGDTVARLGGDEFAVLLETGNDARGCAERMTEALGLPYLIGGRTVRTAASIGVVELGPDDTGAGPDELLARADAAMYAAKRAAATRPPPVVPDPG